MNKKIVSVVLGALFWTGQYSAFAESLDLKSVHIETNAIEALNQGGDALVNVTERTYLSILHSGGLAGGGLRSAVSLNDLAFLDYELQQFAPYDQLKSNTEKRTKALLIFQGLLRAATSVELEGANASLTPVFRALFDVDPSLVEEVLGWLKSDWFPGVIEVSNQSYQNISLQLIAAVYDYLSNPSTTRFFSCNDCTSNNLVRKYVLRQLTEDQWVDRDLELQEAIQIYRKSYGTQSLKPIFHENQNDFRRLTSRFGYFCEMVVRGMRIANRLNVPRGEMEPFTWE